MAMFNNQRVYWILLVNLDFNQPKETVAWSAGQSQARREQRPWAVDFGGPGCFMGIELLVIFANKHEDIPENDINYIYNYIYI